MSVLVTGAAGYIGSTVTRRLLEEGRSVVGVDNLRYGGESLIGLLDHPGFTFIQGDVRDPACLDAALADVRAVVHLAALVGDPACSRDPEYAVAVNVDASKALYESCAERALSRFVFASTCSNYGKMEGDGFVDETSPLRPVSLYAETKVGFEEYLLSRPSEDRCRPTILRFATAYGLSTRMRFDLTVNEFTRDLSLGRRLEVYGPHFWRPYCHVRDLAEAVLAVLDAPPEIVGHEVFNVGRTDENHTKQMLVDLIRRRIPDAVVDYVERREDPRDYRVSFEKIRTRLSFVPSRQVTDGIEEIQRVVAGGFIRDPYDGRFSNTP